MKLTRLPILLGDAMGTLAAGLALILATFATAPIAPAQVRGKKPDRAVYQSPELETIKVESATPNDQDLGKERPESRRMKLAREERTRAEVLDSVNARSQIRRVGHERLLPYPDAERIGSEVVSEVEIPPQNDGIHAEDASRWSGEYLHDHSCDGCDACMGCDSIGCDSIGTTYAWSNSSLCFSPDRWFGSIDLLLMFRGGDRLPPLITTGPGNDPNTAGEIGQAGTQILFGGDTVLKDIAAGGRLTIGTWLDNSCDRSLVLRGWAAADESVKFGANDDQISVLARPFLNVSDNQAAEQDTQLVAFPDRTEGSISAAANSTVFGGDFSVRQHWYSQFGGTIDVLYGYQYMRLDEDLRIFSNSTSLDDDFAPVGSILAINDSFDVENEFHGGQLGFASRYREGCWSFNSLVKVGFGSLRRKSKLSGSTFTSIDGVDATDTQGLLVRDTNSGTTTDHTFGWVPELDFSLGWHRYPQYDVKVGYHLIAMTDALQVSGVIDPSLAVNLSDPPTGRQSPTPVHRDDTFYVHGIHFGMQYAY